MLSQTVLKDRLFLGPTSMDHELSAIMCNIGSRVKISVFIIVFVRS